MATEQIGTHTFAELESAIGNAKTNADIKTAYEANSDTNAFTDADESKLDGIAAGAQVNPSAATIKTEYESNADTNAFTDAEKTNLGNQSGTNTGDQDLSGLQATLVSGTNIKTVNNETLLGSGNIVISGGGGGAVDSVNGEVGVVVLDTDDIAEGSTNLYYTEARVSANTDVTANTAKNSYPSADATKLAGIEAGAEVNDTAAEIKTKYESNANTNAFTDAEQSKLSGISTGAEVNAVDSVFGRTGAVTAQSGDYTKSDVGLANVDNTSDADKPISTATQTALDAKQGDITLTTTGTSGAATLIGDTLNIPNYASGGGGGTVTEVTANAPLSVTNGTTTPDLTLAQATALANGFLSSTDWSTFNTGAGLAATANQDSTATILAGNLTGTINSVAVATVTSGAALGATANQDSTATILSGDLTGTVNSVAVATVTSGAALGATSVQPSDNVSTLTNDADYLPSDPTGVTGADVITNIMSLTQAEYDAIATPDSSTLYIIA